jgi:hypothetical protein
MALTFPDSDNASETWYNTRRNLKEDSPMRRLFALVLVFVLMFCSVATAESIDLSAMTQEELIALIDNARLELTKYLPEAADGTILHEDENVRVTFTGNIELDDYGYLNVDVIVENLSDHNLSVILQNVSCNGWAVWDASVDAPANKKAKASFSFMNAAADAELTSAEDVQDIEADLCCLDSDTWDYVGESAHVIWNF